MSEPTPAAPSPVAKPTPAPQKSNNKVLRTTWQVGEFYDPDSGLMVTNTGVYKDDEPHNANSAEVEALKEKARASRIRLVEEGDDD